MNNILKHIIIGLAASFTFAGCTDWITPDRVIIQNPDEQACTVRDDAYFAALRAYKRTKHKVAFGWYGSWTGNGASYQTRLVSAPDSMDIISIWSKWNELTPEQIADKAYVQKIKGTKVTYTIFLHDLPSEFRCEGWPNVSYEEQQACIDAFAEAYCRDSLLKYDYDGIDLDYEPGFGGSGALTGNPAPELFIRTIQSMSRFVGPKSGTGKLLIIDGVPHAVRDENVEYFDYGISQAYSCTSYSNLQSRFNSAYDVGWKPEHFIFAENFEDHWKTGGVDHTCRDGQRVKSLLGMSRFNPVQGFGTGFGAYHMEYEYGHADKPYKFMRQAIQDANPAGGALSCKFSSSAFEEQNLVLEDDGSITGEFNASIKLDFARPVPEDLSFNVVFDENLVKEYNEKNGTNYLAAEASRLSLAPVMTKIDTTESEELKIGYDVKGLKEGKYLIPLVVELPEDGIYITKDGNPLAKYILVNVCKFYIDTEATALTGTKIAPTADWTISCYQGTNTSGATGVWNCDTDIQKARMFDGAFGSGWYGNTASYSWGSGGNFIIELDKAYEISGFRWHFFRSESHAKVLDFLYSEDGKNWNSLTAGMAYVPKYTSDKWKIFQFKKPVKASYIRVIMAGGNTSMDEAEFYAPAE